MGDLVFACLAPHGSMLIPALAGEQGQKAHATRTAMEELGRRLVESRPETVVVVTPHGHRVDGAFSLLNNQRVRGELGPEKDGSGNSLTLLCTVDKELNTAILKPEGPLASTRQLRSLTWPSWRPSRARIWVGSSPWIKPGCNGPTRMPMGNSSTCMARSRAPTSAPKRSPMRF
jgi:hypothetical protein